MWGFIRKKVTKLYISIIIFLFSRVSLLRLKAVLALKKIRDYLSDEATDTQEMIEIYRKFMSGKATKLDIKKANKQLQDLFKSVGLGVLIILPFAPITLPLVIKLSRVLGVDILPKKPKKEQNQKIS